MAALLSGGAIPDTADYQVRQEPEGTLVGTVNEDWAIESNGGDIFQLGNTSWRILRVETGVVRVADAKGQPPTLPFWLGEAPGRTRELAAEIASLREEAGDDDAPAMFLQPACGPALPEGAASRSPNTSRPDEGAGHRPTQQRVVLERFFDERRHAARRARTLRIEDQPRLGTGPAQEVLRGLRVRAAGGPKKEAIVLSLGPQHSFG